MANELYESRPVVPRKQHTKQVRNVLRGVTKEVVYRARAVGCCGLYLHRYRRWEPTAVQVVIARCVYMVRVAGDDASKCARASVIDCGLESVHLSQPHGLRGCVFPKWNRRFVIGGMSWA